MYTYTFSSSLASQPYFSAYAHVRAKVGGGGNEKYYYESGRGEGRKNTVVPSLPPPAFTCTSLPPPALFRTRMCIRGKIRLARETTSAEGFGARGLQKPCPLVHHNQITIYIYIPLIPSHQSCPLSMICISVFLVLCSGVWDRKQNRANKLVHVHQVYYEI